MMWLNIGLPWKITQIRSRYSLIFKIDLSPTSMQTSRRDLLNDDVEHRSILKNKRNRYFPHFNFTPKTGIAFPKTNVLFSLYCQPRGGLTKREADVGQTRTRGGLETARLTCKHTKTPGTKKNRMAEVCLAPVGILQPYILHTYGRSMADVCHRMQPYVLLDWGIRVRHTDADCMHDAYLRCARAF